MLENRKFHSIPSSVIQHFNHSDEAFRSGIRFVVVPVGIQIGSTPELLDLNAHGLLFIGDACFKGPIILAGKSRN